MRNLVSLLTAPFLNMFLVFISSNIYKLKCLHYSLVGSRWSNFHGHNKLKNWQNHTVCYNLSSLTREEFRNQKPTIISFLLKLTPTERVRQVVIQCNYIFALKTLSGFWQHVSRADFWHEHENYHMSVLYAGGFYQGSCHLLVSLSSCAAEYQCLLLLWESLLQHCNLQCNYSQINHR